MKRLHRMSAAALLAEPAFPRISPDEEFLIRDWLRVHGSAYDEFSIDVPVGYGSSVIDASLGLFDRMWAAITRLRIDVVACRGDHVDIVEAKLHARMPTVTQVLTYVDEYRVEHFRSSALRPVILCRTATPGVRELLMRHRGVLVEMPDALSARSMSA